MVFFFKGASYCVEAAARQLVGPQVDSKWGGWKLYLSGVQGEAQPLVLHTESTTIHLNTIKPAVLYLAHTLLK